MNWITGSLSKLHEINTMCSYPLDIPWISLNEEYLFQESGFQMLGVMPAGRRTETEPPAFSASEAL